MRKENFIYLRKGVRRIEIVTMFFSQEPEKKIFKKNPEL